MNNNKILFELVKKNNFDKIIEIIKNNNDIDLNIRDNSNNYLINYAILYNNLKLSSLLIHRGVKLDIQDIDGRSLLYHVIKYNYMKLLKLLLFFNQTTIGMSLIDIKDKNGDIPINYSIQFNNYESFEMLLNAKSDLYSKNKDGYSPLHLCIENGEIKFLKLLLNHNLKINDVTNKGLSALHLACSKFGSKDEVILYNIIKILLKENINVNLKDDTNEYISLNYTIFKNINSVSQLLIDNDSDINHQDYYGNSIIYYILSEDNIDILNYIYKKNIKIEYNVYNKELRLPLHFLLYEYDKNKDKKVIINDLFLKTFIKNSNLNFQDKINNSCLLLLCKFNLWEKYKDILIKKKLNIFLKNINNKYPFDFIEKNKLNIFINMIKDSYIYLLAEKNKNWNNEFDNLCKTDIFFNKLSKKEKYIINNELKKYNINKININKEVCNEIIFKKIIYFINNRTKINICNNTYPIEKGDDCIIINENKQLKFCTYTGHSIDVLFGLIYLKKKHNNVNTVLTSQITNNEKLQIYLNSFGIKTHEYLDFMNIEITWAYNKLFFPELFFTQINKALKTKKRFIIIPIGILLENGGHANYLIIDKIKNEIERFEPNGYSNPLGFNYKQETLDNILKLKFEDYIPNLKYFKPKDYLPKIGFQNIDGGEMYKQIADPQGFCAIWTTWYVDIRLSYPHINRKKIINDTIGNIKRMQLSFKNLIRNYSKNITDVRDKFLSKYNLDINDWINENIKEDTIIHIKDDIEKIIEKIII